MPTVSAAFTVNGGSPTGGVALAAGSTVNLALTTPTNINSVVWSIVGNDKSTRVNPIITPAGSSPPGSTASFVMPADVDGLGQAYLLQCAVSDGASPASTAIASAVIGVAGPNGLVPSCYGEELERSAPYGWTPLLNSLVIGSEPRVGVLATTVDATVTIVLSAPCAAGTVNRFLVRWVGRKSDGTQVGYREVIFVIYRLAGGNVTQLGSLVSLIATALTDGTWGTPDFVLNTGTQAVDIRVTGKAATNINWYVSYSKLAN